MRIFLSLILLNCSLVLAQTTPAANAPNDQPPQKTAEQVFKNIQALKGTPADQLVPSMQLFSASLGVQCSFCHVTTPTFQPEKDDKDEKKTARTMIAMVQSINQANFKSRPEVTCATCHGGRSNPVGLPPLGDEKPKQPTRARGNDEQLPTPDQVLQSYYTAVGGKAALEKLTSKVTKGSVTTPQGKLTFEADQKAPNMLLVSVTLPNGGAYSEAFNGSIAWRKGDRGPAGELSGPELALASASARFFDPDLSPAPDSMGNRVAIETLNGHECYVLRPKAPAGIFERLYFDKQSGLLQRRMLGELTQFGVLPNYWDYSDYRDVNGVKVPFTTTRTRWDGALTFTADTVQLNAPVEDSKFQKPTGSSPPVPPGATRD
jgi:cytochrome c5